MPATFDAERLVQYMQLLSSPVEGEATSALLRIREAMTKADLRLVDALETDAYARAVVRQAAPALRRGNPEADALRGQLEEAQRYMAQMQDAGDSLAAELDRVVAAYEQLAQHYNALLAGGAVPQPAAGKSPPASRAGRGLAGVLALSVMFAGGWWYLPPSPPSPVPILHQGKSGRFRPNKPVQPDEPPRYKFRQPPAGK